MAAIELNVTSIGRINSISDTSLNNTYAVVYNSSTGSPLGFEMDIIVDMDASLVAAHADIATNELAISNEVTARSNADATLQENINAEASTRLGADSTLQTNINNEAISRANADTSLQGNIDAEATARAEADALKADKVSGATNGHFAGLDTSGNLIDSGYKNSDYEPADSTILKEADVSSARGTSTIIPISQKKFTDDLVIIESDISEIKNIYNGTSSETVLSETYTLSVLGDYIELDLELKNLNDQRGIIGERLSTDNFIGVYASRWAIRENEGNLVYFQGVTENADLERKIIKVEITEEGWQLSKNNIVLGVLTKTNDLIINNIGHSYSAIFTNIDLYKIKIHTSIAEVEITDLYLEIGSNDVSFQKVDKIRNITQTRLIQDMLKSESFQIVGTPTYADGVISSANIKWSDESTGEIIFGDFNTEELCYTSYVATCINHGFSVTQPSITYLDGVITNIPELIINTI